MRATTKRLGILVCALALLGAPASAHAKAAWVGNGGGFGHGVGMSQFGAYGYAKRGFDYVTILTHYYTGTTVGNEPDQMVRVLLKTGLSSVSFSGVNSACGANLNPGAGFRAKARGAGVVLQNRKGRKIANCGPLLATSGGIVQVPGKGSYRGSLEVRSNGGTLTAVNAVALEDYVKGVITRESPSTWPPEALKAQAVAARSYAIAAPVRGNGFDQYDDTRSQVYGGVAAETPAGNQAAAATANQVVLYGGKVAQTYFFSTSGGFTENNENSFLGGTPLPYLRGVPDPYDIESPYHAWKVKYSAQTLGAKLGVGTLKQIVVPSRGVSGRIVKMKAIGTRGSRTFTGPSLRARLGLRDTLVYFTKTGGAAASKAGEPPVDSRVVFGPLLPGA